MADIEIPVVVQASAITENYLGLVNNILRESGELKEDLTSLASPSVQTQLVMDYLNYTVQDIYNEARWTWTHKTQEITPVEDQAEYDLASDFDTPRSDPYYTGGQLRYITKDNLNLLYPDRSTSGTPAYWTITEDSSDDSVLLLYPTPNSDFTSYTLYFDYYRNPVSMANTGDYPDIPDKFIEVLKIGARARFKQHLESQDATFDYGLYQQKLSKLVRRKDLGQGLKRIRPHR